MKDAEGVQVETSQQFDIVETSASGDCLFSSLLKFLHRYNYIFTDVPEHAIGLRMKAVEHISKQNGEGMFANFDRFRKNMKINLQTELKCMSEEEFSNATDEVLLKSYTSYTSTPEIYGTTCELCAIAEIFGFAFKRYLFSEIHRTRCPFMIMARPLSSVYPIQNRQLICYLTEAYQRVIFSCCSQWRLYTTQQYPRKSTNRSTLSRRRN